MPLPKPSPGQNEKNFVNACILDPTVRGEFSRIGQRVAVCHELFQRETGDSEINTKKDIMRMDQASLQEIKDKYPGEKRDREASFTIDTTQKDAFKRTPQGFLLANANFTRSGNFLYGDVVEWRPPEEVFAQESMDSMKLAPVTDEHPPGFLNSRNIKNLQIGSIGQDVAQKDMFLNGTLLITDHEMIAFIDKKRELGLPVELSGGYETTVYDIQGESEEGKYDAIQADIIYNHVAVVSRGRAGRDVKLLDSGEENLQKGDKSMPVIKRDAVKKKNFSMDKWSLKVEDTAKEPVEHVVDKLDEAVGVIGTLEDQIETSDTEKSELQGKVDQLTSDNKKLTKDNEELSDPHSQVNVDRVLEVKTIEDAAEKLGIALVTTVDNKETRRSLQDLKVDIIEKADFGKICLTDEQKKSDSYLKGRLDSILSALKSKSAVDFLGELGKIAEATKSDSTKKDNKEDQGDPREKYKKSGQDAYKTDQERK